MNLAAFQMLPVMMLIAGIGDAPICDIGTCTMAAFLIFSMRKQLSILFYETGATVFDSSEGISWVILAF